MVRKHLLFQADDGNAGDAGGGGEGGGDGAGGGDGKPGDGDGQGDGEGSSGDGDGSGEEGKGGDADAGKEGEGEGKKDGEGAGDGEPDGEKPGEFDTSKLEVPEGTSIDEKWMERFTGNETIQRLTQSEVQGLIPVLGEFVADQQGAWSDALIDHVNQEVKEWTEALATHEFVRNHGNDIERVAALARAARDVYFPDMQDLFTSRGLGSHPTMVVGMARLAEDLGLDPSKLEGGSPTKEGGAKSAAERIFPDYAEGGKHA